MFHSLKKIATNATLAMLILFAACKKQPTPIPVPNTDTPIAKIHAVQPTANRFEWTFEDSSTNAVSRHWNFGDDGDKDTSTQEKVTYTYSKSGAFTVTLVVKSASGVEKTITKEINIRANEKPIIERFTAMSTGGSGEYTFSYKVSSPQAKIVNVLLNCGDGKVIDMDGAIESGATRSYEKTASLTATLKVTNSDGETVEESIPVSPKVITGIEIKKVTLYHTNDDRDATGDKYPDPFFIFYVNNRPHRSQSPTLDNKDCNGLYGNPDWAIWDAPHISFPTTAQLGRNPFYLSFWDEDLLTNVPMGETKEVTFFMLVQNYPKTQITMKSKPDDTGVCAIVDYTYVF